VLSAGGRATVAVWDRPEENPWARIPTRALVDLGHTEAPDPTAPGMFALAEEGRLVALLEEAGFVDVVVDTVELARTYPGVREYLTETLDLSVPVAEVYERLDEAEQAKVDREIAAQAEPYTAPDGSLRLPGRSLVAVAIA
jgi:hypothetical protein